MLYGYMPVTLEEMRIAKEREREVWLP